MSTCNGVSHTVLMENISQSGARVRLSNQPDLDRVMTLVVPGLSPRSCTVRWAEDDSAGVAFIEMIPYVLTIVVLAGFIGASRAPKALGTPYRKES